MSIKGLKLTVKECEERLRSYIKEKNGKVTLVQEEGVRARFSIEIPGQGIALLDVFDTDKGLTLHYKVGKHQDISKALADAISGSCETVTTKTHTFKAITDELYGEFIESFEDDYSIAISKDDEKQRTVKIASTKPDVTVTWYKTTHTLMIQGRTTNVWDEVALWFVGRVEENPTAVIEMIFDCKEKFEGIKISYDETYIETLLLGKIGNAYRNQRVLRGFEVKWLNMSQFFLDLKIDLPDHYPTISASMKIIEGILRRICFLKFGPDSFKDRNGKPTRNFIQFDESKGNMQLRSEYKSKLATPDAVTCVENLYRFVRTKRHPYSHNDGLSGNPAILKDKAEAISLFDEIITLINEVNRLEKELF